tara:strand:- start:1450 stop:1911 length:462 start_codon:yes stop_codon:yes gene_type:complete
MRPRARALTIPASFRVVEIEGRESHPLKHPRADVVARVLTALATSGTASLVGKDETGISLWEASASCEVLGLAVGLLWSHPDKNLDARRRHYEAGEDGDLDYGDAVFAELLAEGYTDAEVAQLGGEAVGFVVSSLPPSAEVVEARVENGAAQV